MIGQVSKQPTADGPHDEAEGKQHRDIQLLYDWIITREKRAAEIECECGVSVKVIPLDQIAHRSDKDRFEAASHIDQLGLMVVHGDRRYVHSGVSFESDRITAFHPAIRPAIRTSWSHPCSHGFVGFRN